MPELPEVETIRRHLETRMLGRRVTDVPHLDARMVKLGETDGPTLKHRLTGQSLIAMDRRGKYLLLGWQEGGWLVIHLGMSGRLTMQAPDEVLRPHTHLVVAFGDMDLRLSDPRRFGRIGWLDHRASLDRRLGQEPLDRRFTGAYLYGRLVARRAPIKALLLDQAVVAGLGNIYADEALFLSQIHPRTAAETLSRDDMGRLVRNIRRVLRNGIQHRGTTFSDYVDALGRQGEHQAHLNVYGRAGKPCPRCGAPVATEVVQGRTSHFCPQCQPESSRPVERQTREIRGDTVKHAEDQLDGGQSERGQRSR